LDVSQAQLSRIEHGLLVPDGAVLERAARVLQCTAEFFRLSIPQTALSPILHRKQQSLGMKALRAIHARVRRRRIEIARLIEATEVTNSVPSIDIVKSGWSTVRAAQELRNLWQVPRGPIVSVTELLEDAGVVVVPIDFGTDLINGISTPLSDHAPSLIFINRNLTGDRQRFTLAHELGHLVMHFHTNRFAPEDLEGEADQFASELLAPGADIRGHLQGRLNLESAARLKQAWGISIQTVIRRARDLGCITDSRYKSFMMQISARGWRKNEPIEVPTEAPTLLAELIGTHLGDLGYTREELARLMYLPPEGLEELLGQRRLRVV
jgi:Zn-dependent peptidase ImmA (M78 family)